MEYWNQKCLEDLFFINDNGLVCSEIWKDIPNYEEIYQGSNLGRLKSLERLYNNHLTGVSVKKAKILADRPNDKGYFRAILVKDGIREEFKTNQLIAITFLNHIIDGHNVVVDHKNNNKRDNRLCNLQLITQRINARKDKTPKSGYSNIVFHKDKFVFSLSFKGVLVYIFQSTNLLDVVKVRDYTYTILDKFNGDKVEFRKLATSVL